MFQLDALVVEYKSYPQLKLVMCRPIVWLASGLGWFEDCETKASKK